MHSRETYELVAGVIGYVAACSENRCKNNPETAFEGKAITKQLTDSFVGEFAQNPRFNLKRFMEAIEQSKLDTAKAF